MLRYHARVRGETHIKPIPKNDGPEHDLPLLHLVQRHRFGIFGYLILLYAAGFTTYLRISPDTAANLLTGQRLARGLGMDSPQGYGDHLVPGFPWLIAGFHWVFGSSSTTALLLFMLGVGLFGLWLVYRLFAAVADRPTAVLMVLWIGVNNALYSYALRPMSDLLFYDGLLLALWGWHLCFMSRGDWDAKLGAARRPRWRRVAMIVAGVVVMAAMRSVVGIVVVAMLLDLGWRCVATRRWWRFAALWVAGLGVLFLIHAMQAGFTLDRTPDEALLIERLVDHFPATLDNALYHTGPKLINEHIAEALMGLDLRSIAPGIGVLALVSCGWLLRANRLWGFIVVLFLIQWALVGTTPRYFIPTIPLLIFGWWRMALWLREHLGVWPGRVVFIILLCFPLLGSLAMSANTMIHQRSRPFYEHFRFGKYAPYIELADGMRETLPEDALIIAGGNAPSELALLSDHDVRREIRHLYHHTGPAYILTPLTPNAQGHIDRGEAVLGQTLITITDHKGNPIALRRLTVPRNAGGDSN